MKGMNRGMERGIEKSTIIIVFAFAVASLVGVFFSISGFMSTQATAFGLAKIITALMLSVITFSLSVLMLYFAVQRAISKKPITLRYFFVVAVVLILTVLVLIQLSYGTQFGGAKQTYGPAGTLYACNSAAQACATSIILDQTAVCIQCEQVCVSNGMDIVNGTGCGEGCQLCKKGIMIGITPQG